MTWRLPLLSRARIGIARPVPRHTLAGFEEYQSHRLLCAHMCFSCASRSLGSTARSRWIAVGSRPCSEIWSQTIQWSNRQTLRSQNRSHQWCGHPKNSSLKNPLAQDSGDSWHFIYTLCLWSYLFNCTIFNLEIVAAADYTRAFRLRWIRWLMICCCFPLTVPSNHPGMGWLRSPLIFMFGILIGYRD